VQEELTAALINARPGDTIALGKGTFELTRGLDLRQENVTILGQGMDLTKLSFKDQVEGKYGLLVTRGGFVLQDLTIENTKGDAVKVEGGDGVAFRRVRVAWTGEPKASNGAYGLYPVQCKNVLIEGCEAFGASDAGIYVGQSEKVVVRHCRAERNVAGIEIENTTDADVHDNVTTNNAGGLLVIDLPDLPVKNGRRVRVFNNKIISNNHANFATPGSLVASVAPGSGLMILATDQVEVYSNQIRTNKTYNLAVVSYALTGRPLKDAQYDPIPEGIFIHNNLLERGGTEPAGERGQMLEGLLGKPVPDIIWDGVVNPASLKNGQVPVEKRLWLRKNGSATFANLRWDVLGPQLAAAKSLPEVLQKIEAHKDVVERDQTPFEGQLDALPEVVLSGVR
jgi:parallel beta-helix repeat protein